MICNHQTVFPSEWKCVLHFNQFQTHSIFNRIFYICFCNFTDLNFTLWAIGFLIWKAISRCFSKILLSSWIFQFCIVQCFFILFILHYVYYTYVLRYTNVVEAYFFVREKKGLLASNKFLRSRFFLLVCCVHITKYTYMLDSRHLPIHSVSQLFFYYYYNFDFFLSFEIYYPIMHTVNSKLNIYCCFSSIFLSFWLKKNGKLYYDLLALNIRGFDFLNFHTPIRNEINSSIFLRQKCFQNTHIHAHLFPEFH